MKDIEHTVNLWNIQLKLFEFTKVELYLLFNSIKTKNQYKNNKYTKKINKILNLNYKSSKEELLCAATHIAVYLGGFDE